jgi:putative inorganic carbon (hco3(-)) transporter
MTFRSGQASANIVPGAGIAVAFALIAAASVIAIFIAGKAVALAILGAVLLILGFLLAGNQRLFCLWGLLITAPLNLNHSFWIAEHLGGASAIQIDLPDFFVAALLVFIFRDVARGYRQHLRLSPVAFWWGALVLLGLANVAVGPFRHLPLLEIFRMLKCFALFFVIINEVVRLRQFIHVFAALTIGVAVQATVAIIQFAFKVDLHLQVLGEAVPEATKSASQSVYYNLEGASDVFRASGLLGHPNLLSAYLALLLPVCLAMLFSRIAAKYKLIVGGVIALGLGALMTTLSRSGWLSFGVAFLILFTASFLHRRLRMRYVLARFAIIALLGLGIAIAWGPIDRRLTESDPGSVNFRIEFMGIAWDMVEEAPVFGLGLNTFVFDLPGRTKYGGARGISESFGKIWPVVHNTWLLTWSEQGTVGFAFFVGLHLTVLWLGFSSVRYFSYEVPFTLNLGCVSGVIAVMVDGMSSFFVREAAPARMFWIVVALIVAINYWNKANLVLPTRQAAAPTRLRPKPSPSVSAAP